MEIKQKIVILDFGGQYNQLIARRVREQNVYCEIYPYTKPTDQWLDQSVKGIILTGGPNSIYDEASPKLQSAPESFGVPVLGICYGMHAMVWALGGKVESAESGEYGYTELSVIGGRLFDGVSKKTAVFNNHRDAVTEIPLGFSVDASTENCACAAISDAERGLYAVQFHPEVNHTAEGRTMLSNFIMNICGCSGDYQPKEQIDFMVEEIRNQVGSGSVVAGLSGGVDSSVACVIAAKALQKDKLTCVFVDHGLLRKDEAKQVLETYRENLGLNVIHVDASERFLEKLKGITDPEQKRKIIGSEFVRVFEEEARKTGAEFLLQGTIYPDIIESGIGGSATIKSHHNVGGLPKDSLFDKAHIVEPLKALFKDEVRAVGEALGVPHHMVWRQPFPGPGLGVRCIGECTKERLDKLRACDAIYREEIANAGMADAIWQYFAVLTDVRTVGVMGDDRTYSDLVALRAVTSEDAMTAEAVEIPYSVLKTVVGRIIGEVPGVNRVVYDITSKPPGTIEWE